VLVTRSRTRPIDAGSSEVNFSGQHSAGGGGAVYEESQMAEESESQEMDEVHVYLPTLRDPVLIAAPGGSTVRTAASREVRETARCGRTSLLRSSAPSTKSWRRHCRPSRWWRRIPTSRRGCR
jgi:hypothetical protein